MQPNNEKKPPKESDRAQQQDNDNNDQPHNSTASQEQTEIEIIDEIEESEPLIRTERLEEHVARILGEGDNTQANPLLLPIQNRPLHTFFSRNAFWPILAMFGSAGIGVFSTVLGHFTQPIPGFEMTTLGLNIGLTIISDVAFIATAIYTIRQSFNDNSENKNLIEYLQAHLTEDEQEQLKNIRGISPYLNLGGNLIAICMLVAGSGAIYGGFAGIIASAILQGLAPIIGGASAFTSERLTSTQYNNLRNAVIHVNEQIKHESDESKKDKLEQVVKALQEIIDKNRKHDNKRPNLKQDKVDLNVLNDLGFVFYPVAGDGHCLYRSASYYLHLDVSALRNMVADELEENLEEYAGHIEIPSDRSLNDYINEVRSGREWASNIEIEILMRVLGRPILVIGPDNRLVNAVDRQRFSGEPIFVRYNGNDHYDGLILRDGINYQTVLNNLDQAMVVAQPQEIHRNTQESASVSIDRSSLTDPLSSSAQVQQAPISQSLNMPPASQTGATENSRIQGDCI